MAQDDSAVPITKGARAFPVALICQTVRRAARTRAAVQLLHHSATVTLLLESSCLMSRSIQILALVEARGAYLAVPRSIDLLSYGRADAPYADSSATERAMPERLLSLAESLAATPALLGSRHWFRSRHLSRGLFLRLCFRRGIGRRSIAEWWGNLDEPFRPPDPEDIRQICSDAAYQPNTNARFWRR